MNNDTAILTLLIELQNDRAALRARVAELEAALAEQGNPGPVPMPTWDRNGPTGDTTP